MKYNYVKELWKLTAGMMMRIREMSMCGMHIVHLMNNWVINYGEDDCGTLTGLDATEEISNKRLND